MAKQIETERIINLSEYEELIEEARIDLMWLKSHIENKNYDEANHLAGRIDLTLHKMEKFEFCIERRIVTVDDPCGHQ